MVKVLCQRLLNSQGHTSTFSHHSPSKKHTYDLFPEKYLVNFMYVIVKSLELEFEKIIEIFQIDKTHNQHKMFSLAQLKKTPK